MSILNRLDNESDDNYLTRLKAMDMSDLSTHQMIVRAKLLDSLEADRRRRGREIREIERKSKPKTPTPRIAQQPTETAPGTSALDRAKAAVRKLRGEDRQRLVLWVASGISPAPAHLLKQHRQYIAAWEREGMLPRSFRAEQQPEVILEAQQRRIDFYVAKGYSSL